MTPTPQEQELKELQTRITVLEESMFSVEMLSVAYLPGGQIISLSMMVGQRRTSILSAKRAVQQVTSHLDDLLVAQVPAPEPEPEPLLPTPF